MLKRLEFKRLKFTRFLALNFGWISLPCFRNSLIAIAAKSEASARVRAAPRDFFWLVPNSHVQSPDWRSRLTVTGISPLFMFGKRQFTKPVPV